MSWDETKPLWHHWLKRGDDDGWMMGSKALLKKKSIPAWRPQLASNLEIKTKLSCLLAFRGNLGDHFLILSSVTAVSMLSHLIGLSRSMQSVCIAAVGLFSSEMLENRCCRQVLSDTSALKYLHAVSRLDLRIQDSLNSKQCYECYSIFLPFLYFSFSWRAAFS